MAQTLTEKLERTGPAEKERVVAMPQSEQLARTPEPFLSKEKEHSHLFQLPDREVGES